MHRAGRATVRQRSNNLALCCSLSDPRSFNAAAFGGQKFVHHRAISCPSECGRPGAEFSPGCPTNGRWWRNIVLHRPNTVDGNLAHPVPGPSLSWRSAEAPTSNTCLTGFIESAMPPPPPAVAPEGPGAMFTRCVRGGGLEPPVSSPGPRALPQHGALMYSAYAFRFLCGQLTNAYVLEPRKRCRVRH